MWHAALALLVLAAEPTPGDAFRWLDPGADAPLVRQVERAFRPELRPDDPARAEAQQRVPVLRRFVERVGVAGTSALVLIGNRTEHGGVLGTWYDAWNHDLATGRKERIRTKDSLFQWRFRGLVSFEPSPVPDILFQYLDCWECESTLSLASFRLDPGSGRWSARRWLHFGKEVEFVEIAKALQHDLDDDVAYEFWHAIGDVTGDGHADIVVERADTGLTTRKTRRRTSVHSYAGGRPVARPPADAEKAAVEAALHPGGPPPRVARPAKGRFENRRFGYSVAIPAGLEAIPRFEDAGWSDGVFLPLPAGTAEGYARNRSWGIGVMGSRNLWLAEDPESPPRPEAALDGESKRSSRTRIVLAGLPGWRVVTRTTRVGSVTIDDTVRLFRRFEADRPGESGDARWVHYLRYELTLGAPSSSYAVDRRVFDRVLASFRLLPLP